MRVLNIMEGLDLGGQQTYTLSLLRHLPRTIVVDTAFMNDGELRPDFESVSRRVLDLGTRFQVGETIRRPFQLLRMTRRIVSLIRAQQSDIVLTHSIVSHLCGALAALVTRTKQIRLVGGSMASIEPTYAKYFGWFHLHRLTAAYLGFPAVLEELRAKGVSRQRLVLLPWAVDAVMFAPANSSDRYARRRKCGIGDGEFVIGWSGRIAANMQVRHTVRLAESLLRSGFNRFRLLIVGGGPWESGLRRQIEEAGLASRAISTGWQPFREIPHYLSMMDVMPLLDDDPQGGSIVREAMSAGVPVVTVNGISGSQADWITHMETGILISPEDYINCAAEAVRMLEDDAELRVRLATNGRDYVLGSMGMDRAADVFADTCRRVARLTKTFRDTDAARDTLPPTL
ncbi:MAG TPA: glycosyltransferase [Gemmatimonadaceae bacterium]|nr:glycosyltransferase [Gemmatimonadaceae bacterium]